MSMRVFPALAVLLLALSAPVGAAPVRAAAERVVMQVALIRHGVRAPTQSAAELAIHAAAPWPSWPVPPGRLTAHGSTLMRRLGRWYATGMRRHGLDPRPCAATPGVKVIADSTPRNRSSAAALVAGLQTGCTRYHALAAGRDDPLFRGHERPRPQAPPTPAQFPKARVQQLQQVLLGCHDVACVARWRARGKRIPGLERSAANLKLAGKLAENLMLAYAQGLPMREVGWGRLDADGIAGLIELHNAESAYARAYAPAARARGGTLLAHVAATLAQAAGQRPRLRPLAPRTVDSVLLIGHDTGLAAQAGLLHLRWHNTVQRDDYPPGGGLIYQLLKRTDGGYEVRLTIALPGLQALRTAQPDRAGGMYTAVLPQPRCGGLRRCPLPRFLRGVRAALAQAAPIRQAGTEPPAF